LGAVDPYLVKSITRSTD